MGFDTIGQKCGNIALPIVEAPTAVPIPNSRELAELVRGLWNALSPSPETKFPP